MSLTVMIVQVRHGPDNPTDPAWWFLSRVGSGPGHSRAGVYAAMRWQSHASDSGYR
jgi:hypothetical protein